jgi:hypothetical protein
MAAIYNSAGLSEESKLTVSRVNAQELTAEDSKLSNLMSTQSALEQSWISFEFFPPKTPEGVKNLFKVMKELKHYNPLFIDMTWGAGGSTSDLTLDLCAQVNQSQF